ncbi:hypothetical protein WG902_16400 [Ramlibacter sp. PS3R-8]|uniref:hypothetical protein n=1 Tax=Ramlibacter sp. PS3R-8 TaxID=3133437 RepID=UPI00309ECC61
MNRSVTERTAGVLLALGLVAGTSSAWARDDKLLLPIGPALRSTVGPRLPGDIAFGFGRASAAGLDAGAAGASAYGKADPFTAPNPNFGGQRARRPDAVVCIDAFRKALAELQDGARDAGATAVVGIVSHHDGTDMDSATTYECHVGHTRGVVELRGAFTRGPVARPLAAAPAAAQPPATAAAGQPRHIASGFAAIDDIDAIPYLSDRGRQRYREWLALPTPKAFAISHTGYFFATSGLQPADTSMPTDPNERALLGCERNAKVQCKLYAVNGSVVWTREPR